MEVNLFIIKLFFILDFFKKEDVEYLQTVLNKNFELRTRLEEKTQNQWVIYIPVRQKIKLIDIVGPYMHESMLYKV